MHDAMATSSTSSAAGRGGEEPVQKSVEECDDLEDDEEEESSSTQEEEEDDQQEDVRPPPAKRGRGAPATHQSPVASRAAKRGGKATPQKKFPGNTKGGGKKLPKNGNK
jgi:hypothetical protein